MLHSFTVWIKTMPQSLQRIWQSKLRNQRLASQIFISVSWTQFTGTAEVKNESHCFLCKKIYLLDCKLYHQDISVGTNGLMFLCMLYKTRCVLTKGIFCHIVWICHQVTVFITASPTYSFRYHVTQVKFSHDLTILL